MNLIYSYKKSKQYYIPQYQNQILETFKKMAVVVDEQNKHDDKYIPMSHLVFRCGILWCSFACCVNVNIGL